MGTKWGQIKKKNSRMGQEWEQKHQQEWKQRTPK